MDEDYCKIAEALSYELGVNRTSAQGTVAVRRCISHIALVLRKMDPEFRIEEFRAACGVESGE